MAKLLTWREDWSLSIDALDADHRALIERLGDICLRFCPEASHAPVSDVSGLLDALTELGQQMREHFRREEAFMREIGYERLGEHMNEHAMLMAEYTEMLRDWRESGVLIFDDSIQQSVRHWMLAHILGSDTDFARSYFQICGLESTPTV